MHILVVGNSGSGKSILAKALATEGEARGQRIIVFDPTLSHGWPSCAIKYADPEAFLEDAPRFRSAYVFIDESADVWAWDEDAANALIYRGRHRGLLFVLIAQRSRMVRPNARNQCRRVYAFRQQLDDAKTLANEYHERLIECAGLPELQGLVTDGFTVERIEVAYDPNRIIRVPDKKSPILTERDGPLPLETAPETPDSQASESIDTDNQLCENS